MRVYALLLATLVTLLSAYTLELAAASAGLDRAARLLAEAAHPAFDASPIWYGGVLRPITVVAYRPLRPALAAARAVLPRATGLE